MRAFKYALWILFVFAMLGCAASINNTANTLTPIEVVTLFSDTYGTARMDEIGPYTTAKFREDKPISVWVNEIWGILDELEYEKIKFEVLDSKVSGNKAVVIANTQIDTAAGGADQKEIYYLVEHNGRWQIDQLVVTDEIVDVDELEL